MRKAPITEIIDNRFSIFDNRLDTQYLNQQTIQPKTIVVSVSTNNLESPTKSLLKDSSKKSKK